MAAKSGSYSTAWLSDDVLKFIRARVAAAGGNPEAVQSEPSSLLRIQDVSRRIGVCRATIYKMMARGEFPRPVHVTIKATERVSA